MPPAFTNAARTTAETLLKLALAEDLSTTGDLTSRSLIDPRWRGTIQVVARSPGILSGGPIAEQVFQSVDPTSRVTRLVADGARLDPGTVVLETTGPIASLLTAERTALNFLTHLSGIATLTRRFVDACAGTRAQVLDTRKTIPGWRHLAKYAVACGGGTNHRMGLYDGVLIKDNHLGAWSAGPEHPTIAAAVEHVRKVNPPDISIEAEVDSLEQLADVLRGRPDIVLLDNMQPDQLREAVRLRDCSAPQVRLEASGGVNLATIGAIAATGVDRISVGGLTHSAPALDLGFDWIRRDR